MIYLPPYLPDYNPIEESFSKLKAWLRRHENDLITPETLPYLIHQVADSITEEDVAGWYYDCGYIDQGMVIDSTVVAKKINERVA